MATAIGVLSTFPPTQCGLATFSAALVAGLVEAGADVGIVRSLEPAEARSPAGSAVVHDLVRGGSAAAAAAALDHYDVALVQHEYGIYGGPDGDEVLDVVRRTTVPVVVVLHTVLTHPTAHQHQVLAELVAMAEVVVLMTETARTRLHARWVVDPARVHVIPHGAAAAIVGVPDAARTDRPMILTWGLLGPGKGIEWALEAMTSLRDLHPRPRYHVVGETHPHVVARDGERYRTGLQATVTRLGLDDDVVLDGRYLDTPSLQRLVRSADIVLLPYDSREQVTSGVLTEAVAAGRPVVSTRFPHAVELLGSGAGLLVPQRDPHAIATALRRLLTEPGLAALMATYARRLAPDLLWSSVAASYLALVDSTVPAARPARAPFPAAAAVTAS